ncbi:MAG: PqiC family protein [Defluviicoccus sp.]
MTRLRFTSLILASLTLAGCSATPTPRFYSLASVAPPASESPRPAGQNQSVAVGSVTLPAYLDRPQVVTRSGVYAVDMAEFDRWSEPLQDMVPRVIAENLSILLGSDQVYLSPRRNLPGLTHQVDIAIDRFDLDDQDRVVLAARWDLVERSHDEVVSSRKVTITEAAADRSYDTIVAAMSKALALLSRDIAERLQAAPARAKPARGS